VAEPRLAAVDPVRLRGLMGRSGELGLLVPEENTNAGPLVVGEVTACVCVGELTADVFTEKLKPPPPLAFPVPNVTGACCGEPNAPAETAGELNVCGCCSGLGNGEVA